MHQEEKRMKVKKGWLAVQVGLEGGVESAVELQRFVIPISYLHHSLFEDLLEAAQQVYGFTSSGPLKLPCSVHDFVQRLLHIDQETHSSSSSSSRRQKYCRHRDCHDSSSLPLLLS